MKHRHFTSLAILLSAGAFTMPILSAQSFNWGNTPNPEVDGGGTPLPGFQEMSFDSDGGAIDASGTFTFELGTFDAGFSPGATNVDIWSDNWSPMDTATYSTTLNYFTGGYTMEADDVTLEGLRAYIWAYNNTIGDETSEWFLVTGDTGPTGTSDSNWIVPEYDEESIAPPLNWRLSTANTAVWGGLNNDGIGGAPEPNEDIGFGIQNADPGEYQLQAFAVPEPSSAIFALIGTVLILRRHRRG